MPIKEILFKDNFVTIQAQRGGVRIPIRKVIIKISSFKSNVLFLSFISAVCTLVWQYCCFMSEILLHNNVEMAEGNLL